MQKPVAFGIGQHDEVRVVGEAILVAPDGAQRDQAVRFRFLFGCAGDVQVEVEARVVLRRSLAELQSDHGPGSARRDEYRGPAAESILSHLVAERRTPELDGPLAIGNSQHHHTEREQSRAQLSPTSRHNSPRSAI